MTPDIGDEIAAVFSEVTGWEQITLGELTASTRPICYGVLKPGPDVPGGVPLIKVQDLVGGTVDLSQLQYISTELDAEYDRSRLNGGEVLLSIQGTVGRVAICPKDLAGANISRTVALIQPDERLAPDFLAYYLRYLTACHAFEISGSTRSSLNIGAIRRLAVPVPPLDRQLAIVEALGHAAEMIERIQKDISAAQTLSKQLQSSVLHAAFTGELA